MRRIDPEARIASGLTASGLRVVEAYLSNNAIPATQLPALVRDVHTAFSRIAGDEPEARETNTSIEKPTPAQIKRSITPAVLISFVDGKPYKTLKRHLTAHGLTPVSYRERYGLPADYPLVAADYAQKRSDLAKEIGLGRPGAMAQRDARRRGSV